MAKPSVPQYGPAKPRKGKGKDDKPDKGKDDKPDKDGAKKPNPYAGLSMEERKKKLKQTQKSVVKLKGRKEKAAERAKSLQGRIKKADSKKEKSALREDKRSAQRTKRKVGSKLKDAKQTRRQVRRYKKTIEGTEGVRNPTIDPFMTADDMIEANDARTDFDTTLQNLDYALEQMRSENEFDKENIGRQQLRDVKGADENAASRGIFHSSIRDTDLFDIDATARAQKAELDRMLDTTAIDNERQKVSALGAYQSFQARMNQRMVENAREAAADQGEWKVKPTEDRTVKKKLDLPKVHRKKDRPNGRFDGGFTHDIPRDPSPSDPRPNPNYNPPRDRPPRRSGNPYRPSRNRNATV